MREHRKVPSASESNRGANSVQHDFSGPEYSPAHDQARLSRQHDRVRNLMLDGRWRTLSEISEITQDPPASVSAQLRFLKREKFGSYRVSKRRRGNPGAGLYEYRVDPPAGDPQFELGGVA